ncbi:UNVERIFIED_CONTAM: hypothetical protein RMT77_005066 [Armadillidium vulgare]
MKHVYLIFYAFTFFEAVFATEADPDYVVSKVDNLARHKKEDCAINRFAEREEIDVAFYSFAVHISIHTFLVDFWCSGTIIASNYVLTSASCVVDKGTTLPKRSVIVYAFDKSINMFGPRQLKVTNIAVHKDYRIIREIDGVHVYNNVALLQLDKKFDESMIVCMPYGKNLYWNFHFASLISWGAICPPEPTNATSSLFSDFHTLRISNYSLIDPCLERIHDLSTIFCSTNHDVKGKYAPICSGDRGGPLILFQKNDVAPLVIGIVSDTLKLAGCGAPFQMVSYTKISEYFQWIHNIVGIYGKLCLRYVKSDFEEKDLP